MFCGGSPKPVARPLSSLPPHMRSNSALAIAREKHEVSSIPTVRTRSDSICSIESSSNESSSLEAEAESSNPKAIGAANWWSQHGPSIAQELAADTLLRNTVASLFDEFVVEEVRKSYESQSINRGSLGLDNSPLSPKPSGNFTPSRFHFSALEKFPPKSSLFSTPPTANSVASAPLFPPSLTNSASASIISTKATDTLQGQHTTSPMTTSTNTTPQYKPLFSSMSGIAIRAEAARAALAAPGTRITWDPNSTLILCSPSLNSKSASGGGIIDKGTSSNGGLSQELYPTLVGAGDGKVQFPSLNMRGADGDHLQQSEHSSLALSVVSPRRTPNAVIKRAKELLEDLEAYNGGIQRAETYDQPKPSTTPQAQGLTTTLERSAALCAVKTTVKLSEKPSPLPSSYHHHYSSVTGDHHRKFSLHQQSNSTHSPTSSSLSRLEYNRAPNLMQRPPLFNHSPPNYNSIEPAGPPKFVSRGEHSRPMRRPPPPPAQPPAAPPHTGWEAVNGRQNNTHL